MNSYYSNPPPPSYYNSLPPPNYGPPTSNNNYNHNYPPPGPPGPSHNYYPPLPNYYNNHYNNGHHFPQIPSSQTIHHHQPHRQPYQQPHDQPPLNTPIPPTTLTITTSPHDSSLTLLTTSTNPNTPPQYTALLNKTSKPQIQLSRGPNNPHHPASILGTAVMHTFSSTTECTLPLHSPGTPPCEFPVKYSSLSGSFTLTHPALGTWKWKADQWTGTSLELIDGEGAKIAKIRVISGLSGLSGSSKKGEGKGKGKGKGLEIYVPLAQPVLDVVVLSGLVAMVGTRGMMEVGVEVAGAVAGV